MTDPADGTPPNDETARDEREPISFDDIAGALRGIDPGAALERLAARELATSNTVVKTVEALEAYRYATIGDIVANGGTNAVERVLAVGLKSSDATAVDATLAAVKERKDTVLIEPGEVATALDALAVRAASNGAWLGAHTTGLLAATVNEAQAVLRSDYTSALIRTLATNDTPAAAQTYVEAAVDDPEYWPEIRIRRLLVDLGADEVSQDRGRQVESYASAFIERARAQGGDETPEMRKVRATIHGDAVVAAVKLGFRTPLVAALKRLLATDGPTQTYIEAVAFATRHGDEEQREAVANVHAGDARWAREPADASLAATEVAHGTMACVLLIAEATTGELSHSPEALDACPTPGSAHGALARAIAHVATPAPDPGAVETLLELLTARLVEEARPAPAAITTAVWTTVRKTLDDYNADPNTVTAARHAVANALHALANDEAPVVLAHTYLKLEFTSVESIDAWRDLLGRLLREADQRTLTDVAKRLGTTTAGLALADSLDHASILQRHDAGTRRDPPRTAHQDESAERSTDDQAGRERHAMTTRRTFYLAGSFARKDELAAIRDRLATELPDWECRSRWLDRGLR